MIGHSTLDQATARQAGVLSRAQCRAAGLTDTTIYGRIASGRWHRLHPAVFATFSGPVTRTAWLWAALLHAGEGAMLSHESAGELTGLVERPPSLVHVTIPGHRRVQPVPGVLVHRSRRAEDARHPSRLPAQTRVEETVVDLTQTARTLDHAFGWLARACGRRLTTPDRIARALRDRRRARWRRELISALDDVAAGCHSLLELRYLRDVERRHGLPPGSRQRGRPRQGGRWYDDVRYDRYATLVELDGRAAHPEESRPLDRRRDNAATVEGLGVLRYGTTDVTERACETAAQIASALRRNGWPGTAARCGPTCRTDVRLPTPDHPQRLEGCACCGDGTLPLQDLRH